MRKKIAVLVGQPQESYQTAFLEGFFQQAFAEDYDVCVFAMYLKHQNTKVREREDSNIFSLVEPDLFEAIVILANTIQTQGVLERIEEDLHERCKKPVIFVDQESRYFPSISADNRLTIKKLVSHLIEVHGYTDIAFLTGNEYHPHARARLQSFLDCMQEHGLEVADNRILYGDFWYNSGSAAAEKLLLDPEHLPQAVACANDFMALGLISALEKEGIRVPQDIAVTGYDASLVGRRASVPLTSIPVPAQEIGAYCVDYVKALLEGKEIGEFTSQAELFIGRSCGCCGEIVDVVDERENWETAKPESFGVDLGVMENDILMQTELLDMMNIIYSNVSMIKPFEGLHLCLNAEWSEGIFDREPGEEYTDIMLDALKYEGGEKETGRVDLTALFDRKELLPEFLENHKKPKAYYFTPLYFEEHCFGYAAIHYGETLRCYGEAYRLWLGAVMRGLESFQRVAVLKTRNAQLENTQIRDALTGLYNYRGFLTYTVAGLAEMADACAAVDVTVLELCGVKEIYLNLGSRDGDRVVVDFAQMLVLTMGQDSLCYLGNDEFLIVRTSRKESEGAMEALLEEIRRKLEQYCAGNGMGGKLSIVFGTMQGAADNEEALSSLIGEAVGRKNANMIRQQRREQGAATEADHRKNALVADILDHNRLIYFFQPIVSAGTGEIYAYEALMRADVPEQISPLDILKCAEGLGRLNDVERATFFNILSYVEAHEELFVNKKVFINSIPGTQMSEADEEIVREKLAGLGGKIVVELTEQAELDDSELEALKQKYERLGVNTAVDDYGTGYSNVYNLLRYMPNVVKIDRMLLANIQLSAQKQHFVKEIIEFSHNNGITVLAEGVETSEELKMVTSLGADLIQGYYTGRPKAEVIQKIDHKIQNEIVQYGQYSQEKNKRSVFLAGQDSNIFLIKLATGHYTKIRFAQENVPHRDVTISGLQGFQANIEIDIEDGYTGRIELQNVELAVHNEQPTIRLGENCDVTLVLVGENVLEQGGILVPESSKLTVQGDGNLRIEQIAVNGYGIGNDSTSRCGDLYFEQDGRIEIKGNTMHGVGIGAGRGGNICIDSGSYVFWLAGEEAVAVGALEEEVNLTIQSCAMEINLRNSVSVGVGSVRGDAVVDISHANVKGIFNAKKCVGIGTLDGAHAQIVFSEGVTEINGRSQNMCGIGSIGGGAEILAANFSITVQAAGKEAVTLGNHTKTARIHTKNSDLVSQVQNQLDYDIGAEVFEMVNGYGKFTLNGEEIVRETITGEM